MRTLLLILWTLALITVSYGDYHITINGSDPGEWGSTIDVNVGEVYSIGVVSDDAIPPAQDNYFDAGTWYIETAADVTQDHPKFVYESEGVDNSKAGAASATIIYDPDLYPQYIDTTTMNTINPVSGGLWHWADLEITAAGQGYLYLFYYDTSAQIVYEDYLILNMIGQQQETWPWLTIEDITPSGQYYDANVPDTLDLAERARIAVGGLTNFLNPDDDYSQYCHMYYNTNPPYMTNYYGQGKNNWGKVAEATTMARSMCGSTENLDIQLASMKGMGNFVSLTDPTPTPMTCVMSALMTQNKLNPEPELLSEIQAMSQAHIDLANYNGNKAYYYDGEPHSDDSMLGVVGYGWEAFIQGRAMRTLTEWHLYHGDAAALSLVEKISNFMMEPKYWEPDDEGPLNNASPKVVVSSEHGHFMGHHHSFCEMILGNLLYGKATNNPYYLEFARGSYEFLRTFGIARIGMFGEMCTTADMTLAAIYLSDFGVGDYWEDVDCYVRNHLTELQYIDPAKMQAVNQTMPALDPGQTEPTVDDYDNVLNRCVGVYLSDASNPALIRDHTLLGVICCTGNCTRALYHAWEAIVRYENGAAQINLLLNRASPWLDIESHLPYAGKVVIRNKTAEKLSVRIPRWVDRESVSLQVNGSAKSFTWVGNYINFSKLSADDVVIIQFPMVETTEQYTLMWKENDFWKESTNPNNNWTPPAEPDVFTFHLKGNTVMDVSPRPQRIGYPLYERTYYQANQAPMNNVTRYIAPYQPEPGECYPRPKADINGDCKVNLDDLSHLVTEWLDSGIAN
jgi:hypothetical protein